MTASAGPVLRKLHREYGDRVQFLTLYVREAHPGDNYPQPESEEQKMAYARAYQERDEIPWPVMVDDLEGSLHRALAPTPHSAYFVDGSGQVMFRALWANDERVMRQGLDHLLKPDARPSQRENRLAPMMSGVGKMHEMLELAGPRAMRDVRREVPPMYFMSRIARLFRPLSPRNRAAAATASVGLGAAVAIYGLARLLRRLAGGKPSSR